MCIKVGKCCCCVDIRTGAIVIAVLGIVGSFGNLAFSTYWMMIGEIIWRLVVSFCLLFGAIKVNEIAVLIYLILTILQIISEFAVGIFFLVAGSALKLVSQDDGFAVANTTSQHQDDGLTFANMTSLHQDDGLTVGNATSLHQDDGFTVANTTSLHQDDGFTVASGTLVGIAAIIGGVYIILWACLDIYFFICVHSFYKKIKDGMITSAA